MNIRFFHMRRAGGHAVIDWVQRSLQEPWWFYNSLSLKTRQPRTFWLRGNSLVADPQHILWSMEDPNRGRSDPSEAVPIAECVDNHWSPWLPQPDRTIIVLRDFYNTVASRLKAEEKPGAKKRFWREGDQNVWLDQARYAATHGMVGDKHVVISFNHWVNSQQYRESIASVLGFEAAPYITKVQKYGGGSSFTGYTTPADERALHNRWTQYEQEIKALETPEIRELNLSIFSSDWTPTL